jgi:hypothetical protein
MVMIGAKAVEYLRWVKWKNRGAAIPPCPVVKAL